MTMVQHTTTTTSTSTTNTNNISFVEPLCCFEEEEFEQNEGNVDDNVDDDDRGIIGTMDEREATTTGSTTMTIMTVNTGRTLWLSTEKPKIPVDRQWIQKLLRKYWYTCQHQQHQLQRRLFRHDNHSSHPTSTKPKPHTPPILTLPTERDNMKLYAYVCAPMVDQSDLPFRMLCRQYGCNLAYTPMIHAKLFQTSEKYRNTFLPMTVPLPTLTSQSQSPSSHHPYVNVPTTTSTDTTNTPTPNDITCMDRPLIGQICGSSIEHVIPTAIQLSQYVDAIDINCGCPQNIAKRGNYGAFLLEQESYLIQLVQTLTSILTIPVTVKVRLLPPPSSSHTTHDTIDAQQQQQQQQRDESVRRSMILYEKLIHIGNVHMICVHGRTRHQKGVMTGPADWDAIRDVVQTFGATIPIMANGSISNPNDIRQCIQYTNVDGVMSSEALLEYPPLFHNLMQQDYYNHYSNSHNTTSTENVIPNNKDDDDKCCKQPVVVNGITLAQQYYDIATLYPPNVHGQGSNAIKVIKIHIHRFCHFYLQNDMPIRQLLINAMTMEALGNVIVLLRQKYGSPTTSSLPSSTTASNCHSDPSSTLSWYYRHRGKVRDCFGLTTNHTTTTTSLSEMGPTLLQAQMEHERTVKSNIDIVIDDDAADCFNALFQTNDDDF